MDNKVIEIARRVATTGVFTSKAESVRYAAEAEESKIGMFADGGMYCFAIGGRYPQRIYSALVYELKKSYNTGVHRVFYDENGVFVAYMPLRKKMRRHGHGSPVPPQPTDILFIGNGNAALLDAESDLIWSESDSEIVAHTFIKAEMITSAEEAVIEINGTPVAGDYGEPGIISQIEESLSVEFVLPDGFAKTDYYAQITAASVSDIVSGYKAKVVLIDSEGKEFAETNEKEIHIQ